LFMIPGRIFLFGKISDIPMLRLWPKEMAPSVNIDNGQSSFISSSKKQIISFRTRAHQGWCPPKVPRAASRRGERRKDGWGERTLASREVLPTRNRKFNLEKFVRIPVYFLNISLYMEDWK